MDSRNRFRLVAPDIDRMLRCFDRGIRNPEAPAEGMVPVLDGFFALLKKLAPLEKNKDAKAIWVTVPRGTVDKPCKSGKRGL